MDGHVSSARTCKNQIRVECLQTGKNQADATAAAGVEARAEASANDDIAIQVMTQPQNEGEVDKGEDLIARHDLPRLKVDHDFINDLQAEIVAILDRRQHKGTQHSSRLHHPMSSLLHLPAMFRLCLCRCRSSRVLTMLYHHLHYLRTHNMATNSILHRTVQHFTGSRNHSGHHRRLLN